MYGVKLKERNIMLNTVQNCSLRAVPHRGGAVGEGPIHRASEVQVLFYFLNWVLDNLH